MTQIIRIYTEIESYKIRENPDNPCHLYAKKTNKIKNNNKHNNHL